MTWWQILIIIAVAGVMLDNMVCNICRTFGSKKKDGEQDG